MCTELATDWTHSCKFIFKGNWHKNRFDDYKYPNNEHMCYCFACECVNGNTNVCISQVA